MHTKEQISTIYCKRVSRIGVLSGGWWVDSIVIGILKNEGYVEFDRIWNSGEEKLLVPRFRFTSANIIFKELKSKFSNFNFLYYIMK